jgi:quercetin dioxygenase-like cupin family protein
MTGDEWQAQGFTFTEAVRGGPLVWRNGAPRLDGDPLGPLRHAHEGAAEYYYLLQGRAHTEVGGEVRVVSAGDLVYIPPDAPHNFYDPIGPDDVWLFCAVAPNLVTNKWHLSGFSPESETLRMTVTAFAADDATDARTGEFSSTWLRLADRAVSVSQPDHESLYLVIAGRTRVEIGRFSGEVETGDYFHVRAGISHTVGGEASSADLIRFNCPLAQWAGVELGGGA